MSSDNNIHQFTALDIEKYHKGLLSATEMHAMEKAAMDDPFLADALEGYSSSGVNVKADLNDLNERLSNRVGAAKVIPLGTGSGNRFNLLRVAVILIFVVGAGLLIYQFGFNNQKKEIAEAKQEATEPGRATQDIVINNKDSSTSPITTTENSANTPTGEQPSKISRKIDQAGNASNESQPVLENKKVASRERGLITGDDSEEDQLAKKQNVNPVTMVPRSVEEKKDYNPGLVAPKTEDGKNIAKELKKPAEKTDKKDESRDQVTMNRAAGQSGRTDNYQQVNTNIFRGRVTDKENIGVPFANVTNTRDSDAGTYTDAKGYFNLTYPDSVLNVQVRSIGFENTNVQLRNNVPTNKVVLNDDRSSLSEVVVSKQKINTAQRKAGDNMKIEEPEPADGWDNYDAYLINNLQTPTDFKSKQTINGTVEVSFEVNKNGEPTNIKVEKSLCNSCDQEAIRLIKEGPKWKRKAKKGRTTVKIPF